MLTSREFEAFDKYLAEHLTKTDAVSLAIVKAIVLAAGGKVHLTSQQVIDIMEGNALISGHRTELGYEISVSGLGRAVKSAGDSRSTPRPR